MLYPCVVADTTKVRIFKQITTEGEKVKFHSSLLLIPQRYEFSSKSQRKVLVVDYQRVVADTTKVRIFKQITTRLKNLRKSLRCCWYHKGTNFQANHNRCSLLMRRVSVVADTTKVRIFKQITTKHNEVRGHKSLLLIPQRYEFSSKSQPDTQGKALANRCCWYHKGTNFQANHNFTNRVKRLSKLLLIPQRYEFSSKSQPNENTGISSLSCCWYHKGTNFQANHNTSFLQPRYERVVADTTKVRIFKQITTISYDKGFVDELLLIPQRYEFSSKSQQVLHPMLQVPRCCWYHKGTNFQANHNTM